MRLSQARSLFKDKTLSTQTDNYEPASIYGRMLNLLSLCTVTIHKGGGAESMTIFIQETGHKAITICEDMTEAARD